MIEQLDEILDDMYLIFDLDYDAFEQLIRKAYETGWQECREKINKPARKFNKNPGRMLKNKHRYHVLINRNFENCPLCQN